MGGRLHDFYLKNQTFMGTFQTEPNYVMVDLGSFPIVFPVKKGTGQKIEGEIYEVDDLHFKTVQTMEEGAGYDTTTDIFSDLNNFIDENQAENISPIIYPDIQHSHNSDILLQKNNKIYKNSLLLSKCITSLIFVESNSFHLSSKYFFSLI